MSTTPGVLAFFIMYCEGKSRTARSIYQDELVKPSPGSRQISLEDFQNVVRDLVVNQELFDAMLRPTERPINAALPQGRSFKCLRGATFALHQYVSGGTAVRLFLMTEPSYSSTEAQRKLASIYTGPFLELVCRSDSVSLRDVLDTPPIVESAPSWATTQAQDSAVGGAAQMMTTTGGGGDHQQPKQQGGDGGGGSSNKDKGPQHLAPALPPHIHNALRTEVLAILKS